MLAALFDLTPLHQALRDGDLILTANDRLRRHLVRAWSQEQHRLGHRAWPAPRIQPLNLWLDSQWQTLLECGYPGCNALVATRHQRQLLWERVISESPGSDNLLQAEPLSSDADAALRALELWRLDPEDLNRSFASETEGELFSVWLQQFQAQLDQCGLITPESAQAIVASAFRDGALPQHARIWLVGFDDLAPLHQWILDAASIEQIVVPNSAAPHNRVVRTEAPDAQNEILAAALWSLRQLEQDADAMIGIIVPDLGQRRAQVERLFNEVFESAAASPHTPRYTLPFNFSAGQPLGTTPLIDAALNLLRLSQDETDLEPLCALIHSPFWGQPEEELVLRTQLTDQLRRLGKFKLTGSDWRHYSQRLHDALGATPTEGPSLAERLQQLDSHRRRQPARASAEHWANVFSEQLELLGWPGTRRLDSQEYQQVTLWYEVLESFRTLDLTNVRLSLRQALKQLSQLALQTPFQAQTPDSPIQILGALEGAGLRFSHCWVLGLHHRQWPPPPAPNPLLPLELQRQHHMPHASAERELRYAQSLTENYLHCAAEVVFSSPAGDDQGDLRPSPLIRALPLCDIDELIQARVSGHQAHYQKLAEQRQLEPVNCAHGPTLNLAVQAAGGAGLFKQQASCPFNAFARLRLGAVEPSRPSVGLSPAERGTVLHDTLAFVWTELKNSDTLHHYGDDALRELIDTCAERALAPIRERRPRELGATYCQLERERLQQLLFRWLELEKQRPPFEVVAIEEAREVVFSGLTLSLRIDRVDRMANGELLLIDYKTGNPTTNDWLSDRPNEPQLPLYTVTQPEGVAGVAFGQLNAQHLRWLGMGELQTALDGIKSPPKSWDEQVQEWHEVLQQLAEEYIAGEAQVTFHDAAARRYNEELLPLNRALEADALSSFISTAGEETVYEH